MKRFSCGDLVPGCAASWEAPDDAELLSDVARHAAEVHGLDDLPAEVRRTVLDHAHEAV